MSHDRFQGGEVIDGEEEILFSNRRPGKFVVAPSEIERNSLDLIRDAS